MFTFIRRLIILAILVFIGILLYKRLWQNRDKVEDIKTPTVVENVIDSENQAGDVEDENDIYSEDDTDIVEDRSLETEDEDIEEEGNKRSFWDKLFGRNKDNEEGTVNNEEGEDYVPSVDSDRSNEEAEKDDLTDIDKSEEDVDEIQKAEGTETNTEENNIKVTEIDNVDWSKGTGKENTEEDEFWLDDVSAEDDAKVGGKIENISGTDTSDELDNELNKVETNYVKSKSDSSEGGLTERDYEWAEIIFDNLVE